MVVGGQILARPDDVSGADLRSPHHRWARGGAVSRRGQGLPGGSGPHAVADLSGNQLMPDSFDVVVIGGGPAGYPAAIRAAQNKLTVACIDEWKNREGLAVFGGTCLNAGCIPSKALLESTELYHRLREEFAVHGIRTTGASVSTLRRCRRARPASSKRAHRASSRFSKASGVTAAAGSRQACCRASACSSRRTTARRANLRRRTSCSLPARCRSSCALRRSTARYILDSCGRLGSGCGAETARRHRRRRDRSRTRQRLAAPGQ